VVTIGQRLRSPEGIDVERGAMDGVTLLGRRLRSRQGLLDVRLEAGSRRAESYELEVLDERGAVVWGAGKRARPR
jgi:hypothetical protein